MEAIIFLWVCCGLTGSALLLSKSAFKGRATAVVLFSLPHAIIFGPLFLQMNLATLPQQICPHCQSSIPRSATVCSKGTRGL